MKEREGNLTHEFLSEYSSCDASLEWVKTISKTKMQALEDLYIENPWWALWLAPRMMTRAECGQLSIYAIGKWSHLVGDMDALSLSTEEVNNILGSMAGGDTPKHRLLRLMSVYRYTQSPKVDMKYCYAGTWDILNIVIKWGKKESDPEYSKINDCSDPLFKDILDYAMNIVRK